VAIENRHAEILKLERGIGKNVSPITYNCHQCQAHKCVLRIRTLLMNKCDKQSKFLGSVVDLKLLPYLLITIIRIVYFYDKFA